MEVAKPLAADTYYTSSMSDFLSGEVDLFVKGKKQRVTNFAQWPLLMRQFRYDAYGQRFYRKMNGDTIWTEPTNDISFETRVVFLNDHWIQRGNDSIPDVRTMKSISIPVKPESDSPRQIIFDKSQPVYAWYDTYFIDADGEYRTGTYMIDLQRQLVSPVCKSIFHLKDNIFTVLNWKNEIGLVAWR